MFNLNRPNFTLKKLVFLFINVFPSYCYFIACDFMDYLLVVGMAN